MPLSKITGVKMKTEKLLEEFSITELEDRLEFGICGGGGGDGDGDGGGGCDPASSWCDDKDQK